MVQKYRLWWKSKGSSGKYMTKVAMPGTGPWRSKTFAEKRAKVKGEVFDVKVKKEQWKYGKPIKPLPYGRVVYEE